jgi:hypothetical protein
VKAPPEPPYDTSDLGDAGKIDLGGREGESPRGPRPRALLPLLGVLALLLIKVGALGLLFPGDGNGDGDGETGAEGYWHLYFPSGRDTAMTLGAPVVADRHRIGEIVAVTAYRGDVAIGFHIDTSYNSLVQSEPGFAVGPIGDRHLCFGTRRECGKGSADPPVTQLDPPGE